MPPDVKVQTVICNNLIIMSLQMISKAIFEVLNKRDRESARGVYPNGLDVLAKIS